MNNNKKLSRRSALKTSSSVIAGALIGTTGKGLAQPLEEGRSGPIKVINNSSKSGDTSIQFTDLRRKTVFTDTVITSGLNDSAQTHKTLAQKVTEAKVGFSNPGRLEPGIYDVSVEFEGQTTKETIGIPPSKFSTGFRVAILISDQEIRVVPKWVCKNQII